MKFLFALFIIICNHSDAQTSINIDSSMNHIGEKVTICTKIFSTKYLDNSKMTFLNAGAAYPNSPLTIVIFGKDRTNFKDAPETLYANKDVCVTGLLKEYKGKAEIVVTKPEEIIIK
jgi:hypothetical protein